MADNTSSLGEVTPGIDQNIQPEATPQQNGGQQKKPTMVNYAKAFLNQMNKADVERISQETGLPVKLPDYETFKGYIPNLPEQDVKNIYDEIYKDYALYDAGKFDRKSGVLYNLGKTHYTSTGEFFGWNMREPVGRGTIPMDAEFGTGPGFEAEPIRLNTPDQLAEDIGFFLTKEGSLAPNTFMNRLGRFLATTPNPDPNSPVPYFYREINPFEAIKQPENIRSIFGPQKVHTPTIASLINARAFVSELLGTTLKATGGTISALTAYGQSINSKIRTGDWRPEGIEDYPQANWASPVTALANSLTNLGAYMSQVNMDESEGAFSSASAISNTIYGGLGQLMSIALAGRISARIGMSPRMSMSMGLGLGGAQNAAHYQQTIIDNGGSELDAAVAWMSFFGSTILANMVIPANIAERTGIRRISDGVVKNVGLLGEAARKSTGSSIGALPAQSRGLLSTMMSAKGVNTARNLRYKVSSALTNLSDKKFQVGKLTIPVGYNIGMGLEEFVEEGIEELFQMPLEKAYNKHLSVPRAKEVNDYYSKFLYDIERSDLGTLQYVKYDRSGKRIELDPLVWKAEQDDLLTAQNILKGDYTFDAKFSWDEPFAALLSSFIGGTPVYYVGGAHKARKDNDVKYYRQSLALDIARKKQSQQANLMKEVRDALISEQQNSGIFGPDFLTADGQVITDANKAEGLQSVAEVAIGQFMQDLALDVENIQRYGLNNPQTVQSLRQNNYLYHEALDAIEAIRKIEAAIAKHEADGTLEESEYVRKEDTIETVKERLTAYRELYRYVTEPKDGPNGKRASWRYSELHFSGTFLDFVVGLRAKRNVEKMLSDKGQAIDPESADYKSLLKNESERIKKDQQELWFLSWTNEPSSILNPQSGHKTSNIWSFLNHVYKKMLGAEMTAIKNERNALIKAAQTDFQNIDTILGDFEKSVSEFREIDMSKFEGKKLSAVQRAELEGYRDDVLKIQQSINRLSNVRSYNEVNAAEAERLTNAFNSLLAKVQPGHRIMSGLASYAENAAIDIDPEEGVYEPSGELTSFIAQFDPIRKQFESSLTNPAAFQRSNEIGDLNTEQDSALVSSIREEAYDRLLDGINTVRNDGGPRQTVRYSDYIADILQQIENPHSQINNGSEVVKQVNAILHNLKAFREILDVNANFLPELSNDEAEHSMLNDGKSNHLYFTKEEFSRLSEKIDDMMADAETILASKKLAEFNRELDQTRFKVNNLSLRNYFLGQVRMFFAEKAPEDFDRIFMKEVNAFYGEKDPADFYHDLFEDYYSLTGTEQEVAGKKKEVMDKLLAIEKAIIKAEEALSGKLDDFIKEQLEKRPYMILQEFGSGAMLERSGNKISGSMTVDRINKPSDDETINDTRSYFLINHANIINRFGRPKKSGEKTFTISEVLQAFREVTANRNALKEKKTEKDPDEIAGTQFNVTTYEQERLALHVLGFLINPDASALTPNQDVFAELVQKGLYVRGYAGTGKTTQLLMDIIQTYEELTGKEYSVSVIVPTGWLQKTHLENFAKIGKEKFKIQYIHKVVQGEAVEGDLVIIDEGGLWKKDQIKKIRERLGDKTIIWLGDDAQTPPKENHAFSDLPIRNYAAERTDPITEVFRSGNPQHFAIQDYFRAVANGSYNPNMPKLNYDFAEGTGLLFGGRYFRTEEEMRDSFIDQYSRLTNEQRGVNNIIYIVPRIEDRKTVIDFFEKKLGKEKAQELSNFVFTVEYLSNKTDFNYCISGLSTAMVFFEFEANKYANQIGNTKLGAIDLAKGGVQASMFKRVGRAALTGSSRATHFLGLIGNPELSETGSVPMIIEERRDQTILSQKKALVDRLTNLTDGKTTYRGERTQEKTSSTSFNRALMIDPATKEEIASSPKFKLFKSNLEQNNQKSIEEILDTGETLSIRATNVSLLTESVQAAISKRSDTFDYEQTRIRHAYFSSVVRYLLTGNEQFANEARGFINELNDHYKATLDEKAQKKAIIQNPEAFFVTTLTNVQTRFDLLLSDPLTVFTPTIFNDKITVKGENGETQEMLIEGHPLALKLVGYDQTGKPIVDLEELVIHNHINSYKGGVPGVYTKAKVGSYVAMLTKSGMIVNRVTLNNYLAEGATLDFLGANQMSDADIVEGLEEVKKVAYLNNELQIEEGEELATSEQFFSSRRIFSDPKFPTHFNFVNDETGDVVTIDHVAQEFTDGKWNKTIFYRDENNKVLSKNYNDFQKEFVYIKESTEYYDGFKHKTRAEFYADGTKYNNIAGAIQNHTLVLPLTDAVLGQSIQDVVKSKAFNARVTLLGKISKMRSLEVEQVYNDNFENTYLPEDSDIFTRGSFRAVITTELTEDFMQAEAGTILRKTLVEADIIKAKAKVTNEEIVRLFKENRYHILGIQNDPEHTFRSGQRGNISVLSFPEAIGFINATTGDIASEQFKRLEERILLGFKGDANKDILVRYNLHKLVALRHLKMLGKAKARITDVEIGNIAEGNQTRNGQDFVNEMASRGFRVSEVKLMPIKESDDGRAYFYADFTRDNFPGNRRVIFDAVKAQPDDITAYIDDVKMLLTENTEFKKYFDEINKLKSKTSGKKMSKTEIDQLKEMYKAAVLILESRPGFQFLKANKTQLRTLEGEIRSLAKKGTVKIDGKVKKVAGLLYEWHEDNMFLLGESIEAKFLNLISVLQAVKSYYAGALSAENTNVSFRKNPFLSSTDEGHITAEGKVGVDLSKLETNVREIKTPEVYVRPENQENYEDMVRSIRSGDEAPSAAKPGETNKPVVRRKRGPNLHKERTTSLPFDTISAQEAVNEANRLIGEANAEKYFNIKPFEIVTDQDKALFGRLIKNIVELSGYDLQFERVVHAKAPRHELMHLIMNYILNEQENQKVLENIQELLAESWDGTIRQLYEYAAETFEFADNIQKPKNWFEKFIFFLKKLANRIGLYRYTFNEMLLAAESGYYHNAKVHDLPNHDFDTLEKSKDIDGYDNRESLMSVVERFGTPAIYSYYRDQVLANRLKSYMSYGRSLMDTGGSFAEALYMTRLYFKRRAVSEQIGKRLVDVSGKIKPISELTPQDFIELHYNDVSGSNQEAIGLYVDYQLSDHFNLVHMVKELFPNTNLRTAERVGRVMAQGYNATRLRKQGRKAKKANTNVSSAAKNIHADAETQNAQERISDELGFVLSTIPIYIHNSDGGIDAIDGFLHNRHVQKIFQDSFRRLLNNNARQDIDFEMLMGEIERMYMNELEPGPIRDAYYSVWLEFGTEDIPEYTDAGAVFDTVGDTLNMVGYLAMLKNPERYNNIRKNQVDFRKKAKAIHDIFSAIISHFGSVEVLQQGIANLDNGRIEQRANTSESLLNYLLKQSISGTILDEEGITHAAKGKMLTPGEGEFFVNVTPDGFSIYDHGTQTLTPLYSIKENINVESVAQLERIFGALGLGGYNAAVLRKMLKAKNRERGERSIHTILHSFLLATKVNYEMGKIANDVIGVLNSEIDELRAKPENETKSDKELAKDIEWVDIEEVVLSKLDTETRAMYDYLVNKYYKLDKNEAAKFKMETRIYFDPFEQVVYLPSPLDFHTMTRGLAEMMVEVNLEEPRISVNAEGERVYTQGPASLLTELQYGSENFIRPRREKIRFMAENQLPTPFVTTTPDGFRINNPFFSDKVAFDKPWTLTGAKYLFRGSNYQNLTESDLMVVMLRDLFAYKVTAPYSFGDVSVVMSPFADKVEAKVLPFFLKSKSQKGVAAEKVLNITRNKARKIVDLEVNYDPFVDAFEDLVNYYRERREKSIRSVAEVLRIKESKLRDYIKDGSTIFLNKAERKRVEAALTFNRDYRLERNPKNEEEYIFVPGRAITQEGVVFNEGFAQRWFSLKTKKCRYNLLKRAIAEDFLDFAAHLRNTGAWNRLLSDSRLGDSFFSTFKDVEMGEMVFGRIEESESDMATESVNPGVIGSRISETIIARRNQWFKEKGYRKDGTKALEGETLGEAMTMADFNEVRDTEVGAEIRKDMATDKQLSDDIKKINQEARKIEQQYTTQSVEAMDKANWAPALEAFYMTYWLANESIAHITRGDATIFSSPSEYIKRGAGFKAPGTFFDLHNPYGIGRVANVAVLRDIPGFNTFLGVTPENSDPELFTNGHSKVNPVWFKLLQRSAGGNLGVVGDFATKTVVYGNDIVQDNNIYFKFSQLPIDSTHYRNSALHKGLMKAMLGEYTLQFEAFLSQNDYDFDRAVELMADWVVDPKNVDENGLLPRDKMVSYIVHPSAFKNGLTGLQDYEYFGDGPRSAFNVMAPSSLGYIQVPNEFMRLQTVNNGDGNVNLHSFATQLFGVLGVMEHNLQYAERFNSALTQKIELFNQEVRAIFNSTDNEVERGRQMLAYLKKIVLQNAGRSTRGSKMERLLSNPDIVGDVFSNKFFESFISHLNDYLKPDVMGNNMPQQSGFIRMYEDNKGQVYLPSDLGLADDEAVSLPHRRRLLRPMSYASTKTGKLFATREELQQALENDPEGKSVVTLPAEIIAKFHYAKEFDLADDISLHDVMDLANGESLYETGFQRVTNQGAVNADDMSNRIVEMTGAKTVGDLVQAFKHSDMRAKFTSWVEALALSELRKDKAFSDSKEDVQDRMLSDRLAEKMQEPIVSEINKAIVNHSILKGIGKYYFDLNNALDIISVRIPTTNASSASIGRFVAFSNTGNSIFTSPEKSILDGSDYDHDELHVFYPTLSGTSKVTAIDREQAKEGRIHKFADNIMFDAVFDFYRDARNNPLTLAPIKLNSLRQYAAELSDNSTQAEPQIINTPFHNIRSTSVNFAGRSLVGHFANQMIFTNRLLSQSPELLTATVNPALKMVLDPINNPDSGPAVYVEVLDFISKLVNAATDNANENGLLGRLNINGAVTNLMAGKVLHTVPMTLITEAMEGVEGAAQQLQVTIEKQVLDMLQDPHVKKASRAVIDSNSIFNTRKRKTIWGALQEVGKGWTSDEYVNKLNELLDYAYTGEQLNRLGNLFKMTQGMPGDKGDFFRLLYQIEKALGQRIETFLDEANLEYLRTVDFSNETSRKEAVAAQVKSLLAEKIMLKDDSSFNEADEYGIREKINIPRIAASNQLILTQLRSLLEFKRASQYLFFNESHPEIRTEILSRTGNAELLYQEGFNDYENSIKKALISRFMLRNAPSDLIIPIQKIELGEERVEDVRYNLKKAKEQAEFLANFYDHLAIWKKMLPNVGFLKNIDFEKRGRMSWMTPNFRNSIYIDPLEKAQYTAEFNNLAEQYPEIADAIRYANLLTFGFSFRNGTFAEVIDDKIERAFSHDYNGIVSLIENTLVSNKDAFLDEIVANGDQMVSPSSTFTSHYGKRQSERSSYYSLFKKVDAERAKDGYEGQENYILFNHIYPKEIYISDPSLPVVTDFVYRNLGKAQLAELRNEGSTIKQSSRHTGVSLYEKTSFREVKNVPFDHSYVYTEFGDLAQVFYDSKNQAEFRLVEDPKIKESRVANRTLINNLSEQTLGAFFELMQRAFPGVQVNFVNNRTSLTQGIGYFHQGQVYLNRDRLQADTTMHELSHPFVMALKALRPAQYNMLKNDAIRLLENNDISALIVAEKYPELSGNDLIDEIISNIVGWESEQSILNFLATGNDVNYKRNSRNLWERLKGRIKGFWNTIKSWFSKNEILIDPEISTIRDLASALVTKALKGEPVFNIKRSDLMNMVRLTSDQIFEQKAEARKDAYGVYDLLMNTGTYMKDGQKHTIKQYRDLDRSERIENIINRLPNMGYVYKTKSGENIIFDPRRREEWSQIIIDNVLDDYDEFGSNLKEDFISALKMQDFSVSKMVEFFGEDDNGDPIFTELTVKRFLNQVNYHPRTKYMLYSDLANSDYRYLYDENLVGINPIVAIEYESDDQVIVSLYQLSNQYVRRRDKMSPKDTKNILTRYMRDATARRRGISLESNMGDVSNLLMGIAASEFTRKGKRVKVNQVGTISVHRTGTHMVLADGLELKRNISAMLENQDFLADITPEMKKYFENFRLMTDGFDYEAILMNKYNDLEIFGEDIELYKKGELDVNRKILIYNSRMRDILHLGDKMTTEDMAEVSLLLNALATLYNPNVMSDELNTRKDIDKLQKNIFPQFDVNHEMIDTIRRATLSVSQDNVRELQNFKKTINDFAEFFRNRYEARRGSLGKFIKDTTFKYYDEVLAKVTDQDGNQRFAGHILWTTDANLDPMFYQQAQQADPEVIKWGKFLVDLITEQMAENYRHMRIMRSGETIWTEEGPVTYSLEKAREDLFEKTSYKPGMLPLMSETVGSLLGRGKLGEAFGKRLKQIQSSYLQFDDIADLQEGQADALDRLPEMFMRQFDKKNEFEVGSLGLVKARMEDLLGLAEQNGQYIFLDKSKRSQNLNTDLETLMEFFKMASIRKINYENKVLPLVNGAVMYMNDLHSNKDFKQENALDYLNLFRKQAIEGKRFLSDIEMSGVNVEALATTAMSYASPLVMALNINVGAVSAIHNFMMAFIEGVGNDIYNALNPEQRSHWFTTSDLVKASGLFFYDFHKVTQLLRDFQLLNPNEYELIMHRFNQSKSRKQHVFSDFYAQFTNWAADAYARGVILVAQMLRDGSYYAYSYDEKTGALVYNEKQDRQFYKEDGTVTKEQAILRDTVEKSLKSQGWGTDQNGKMLMGYDKRQMRSFKALADKYVLGAYGPMEKNMLSQFFLGRMAMMFSTWAMTKISTAFKKGSYIDELGYYDIAKDEKGNLIPKWQREWTEGYLTTVVRMTTDLLFTGNVKQFKSMKPGEQRNWIRYMLTISFWLLNMLAYRNLVGDDKPIPDSRMARNVMYAYGSLLVLPLLAEKLDSPFAVVGIVKRALMQGLTFWEGNWWNLRFVIPVAGGAYTVSDFINSLKE